MQPATLEAHAEQLLAASETFDLARYCVVGSYTRHDETVRHRLRDAYLHVVEGLKRPSETYEHHLLWASPGTGKTRLALAVAEQARRGGFETRPYPDGAVFVDLSAVTDPSLVVSTIAQALGVREAEGQPLLASLIGYLRGKRMLLLLDNFEQVVDAAPLLHDLLAAAPDLTLLVTSRVLLRLSGEKEYSVAPLATPPQEVRDRVSEVVETGASPAKAEQILTYPAVRLFVDRARGARPGFALTDENVDAVVGICTHLDGLPLAIELAAARTRVLAPQALHPRLEHRLTLLVGGTRDAPARQRTLRDTIAWSYDLLTPAEQVLFQRLTIFAGSFTLGAAEAVCEAGGDLGIEVLDGIASLVEKGLLREADGPGPGMAERFRMLETLREFGLEQLAAGGDADGVGHRHALFYAAVAEECHRAYYSAGWKTALARVRLERDNLRTALGWAVERDAADVGARLVRRLWVPWFFLAGALTEARQWCEALLALPSAADPTAARAALLMWSAATARIHGDRADMSARSSESVAIARECGDPVLLALALYWHGEALAFTDPHTALPLREECVAVARATSENWLVAIALFGFWQAALACGDLQRAARLIGATAGLRERFSPPGTGPGRQEADAQSAISTALGAEGFATLWEEGRALSLEAAVALALGQTDAP